MSYVFKIYLKTSANDVRRLRTDNLDFKFLQDNIEKLFNINSPKITWFDGMDDVTISSDNELLDAVVTFRATNVQITGESERSLKVPIHLSVWPKTECSNNTSTRTGNLGESNFTNSSTNSPFPGFFGAFNAGFAPGFNPGGLDSPFNNKLHKKMRKHMRKHWEACAAANKPGHSSSKRHEQTSHSAANNKRSKFGGLQSNSDEGSDSEPSTAPGLSSKEDKPKVIHNVVCDGCETVNIEGDRFKCVVCSDYDLCSTCFSAGVHRQHNMLVMRKRDNNNAHFVFTTHPNVSQSFSFSASNADPANTASTTASAMAAEMASKTAAEVAAEMASKTAAEVAAKIAASFASNQFANFTTSNNFNGTTQFQGHQFTSQSDRPEPGQSSVIIQSLDSDEESIGSASVNVQSQAADWEVVDANTTSDNPNQPDPVTMPQQLVTSNLIDVDEHNDITETEAKLRNVHLVEPVSVAAPLEEQEVLPTVTTAQQQQQTPVSSSAQAPVPDKTYVLPTMPAFTMPTEPITPLMPAACTMATQVIDTALLSNMMSPVYEGARQAVNILGSVVTQPLAAHASSALSTMTTNSVRNGNTLLRAATAMQGQQVNATSELRRKNLHTLLSMGFGSSCDMERLNSVLNEVNDDIQLAIESCLTYCTNSN